MTLHPADGPVLDIVRRKRDKASLSTPAGEPVDEAILREALGGLPPDEFRAMFLLGRNDLERGSRALLDGHGLLGEALFGAALGLGRVHELLAELDAEAERLWVKGGTRTLNREIKALSDARSEARRLRLDPAEWSAAQDALHSAESELSELSGALVAAIEDAGRAERYGRILPTLIRRRAVLEALDNLDHAPELRASFVDDVASAAADLSAAQADHAETHDELLAVRGELDALPDDDTVADRAAEIAALHLRAGQSAKADADLTRRHAELDARTREVDTLAARVRHPDPLAHVDELRVGDADRARLDELADEHAAARQRHDDAHQAAERLRRRHDDHLRGTPPDAPDPAAVSRLTDAVEQALPAADLDDDAGRADADARRLRARADERARRLAHHDGDAAALAHLTTPTPATVSAFDSEQARLALEHQRLADRQTDLDARRRALDEHGRALAAGPLAPTRDEVTAARHHRDQAIGRAIAGESVEAAETAIEHVRAADDLADRRADHADAAAARDHHAADVREADIDAERLDADRAAARAANDSFAERWAAEWPGLNNTPGPPTEMREWLAERDAVLADLDAADDAHRRCEDLRRRARRHRQTLAAATGTPADAHPSLAAAVGAARAELTAHQQAADAAAQHRRDSVRLVEELADADARVTSAATALAAWSTAWAPLARVIALADDASPAEARAQLAAIDDLVAAIDACTLIRRRVDALHDDQRAFAADVAALVAAVGSSVDCDDPRVAVELLHERAGAARATRVTRDTLRRRAESLAVRVEQADVRAARATARLGDLADLAKVAPVDLDGLCELVDQRDRLRDELAGLEHDAETIGADRIDVLADALADATPEALAGAREAAQHTVETLEQRRGELERTVGRLRAKLDDPGGADGAGAAERAARSRAALVAGVERYAEVKLAAAALRSAVERHRLQHQGPLLDRAGALFATLTCGNMSGLVASLDHKRRPVLLGVRPDDREVAVDGMSDGQRDQLFLALRLASLECHFEHAESMPIVLDDILVNFDDASAAAALKALADVAVSTQVLFFTHHDHLVELARTEVPEALLAVHEIGDQTQRSLRAA